MGALSNPFDADQVLWTGCPCGLHATMWEHQQSMARSQSESRFYFSETTPERDDRYAPGAPDNDALDPVAAAGPPKWEDDEAVMARCVETAVMKGLFRTDVNRRAFLRAVGASTALAAISQFIPLDKIKAAVLDAKGPLEKSSLNVGFVPITCATPIIMAHPMGFYKGSIRDSY